MALAINDAARISRHNDRRNVKFHDWIGDNWAVLFSHPKDFTPVCTTELGHGQIKPGSTSAASRSSGSVDPVDKHASWANDIKETQGFAPLTR
jgi:alkyl hydroperoxide reductase subunit AhpC